MYADTHTHLTGIQEKTGTAATVILAEAAAKNMPFILDIGTDPGDLQKRCANAVSPETGTVPDFLYFSAGLWPAPPVIADRENAVARLEQDVTFQLPPKPGNKKHPLLAIGECGYDRRANPQRTGAETELFEMQILLAKKHRLPLIIHSRDAFDETFSSIKNCGWDCGVMHCFSYTKQEAKLLLDRGWFLSFSGTITYRHTDLLAEVVRYVPDDLFLIETDAPYLAPAPFRGKDNTPLLIEHTYKKAAELRQSEPAEVAAAVLQNAKRLFKF